MFQKFYFVWFSLNKYRIQITKDITPMEVFFISVSYKFGFKFFKQSSKNTHNEFLSVA